MPAIDGPLGLGFALLPIYAVGDEGFSSVREVEIQGNDPELEFLEVHCSVCSEFRIIIYIPVES